MEGGEGRSSSNDLSSAPNSDIETPPNHRAASNINPSTNSISKPFDAAVLLRQPNHLDDQRADSTTTTSGVTIAGSDSRQGSAPVKARKPRKKKEPATGEVEKKEKPPRKPRATGMTAPSRKKPKLEDAHGHAQEAKLRAIPEAPEAAKQPSMLPALLQNTLPAGPMSEAAKITQMGLYRPNHEYENHRPPSADSRPTTSPQQASMRTSIYDPVRSMNVERLVEPTRPSSTSQITHTPPRLVFNPHSSPTISSMIDQPTPSQQLTSSSSHFPSRNDSASTHQSKPQSESLSGSVMDMDTLINGQTTVSKSSLPNRTPSEGPSKAPSPKPTRAKEVSPPPAQGTGLLSSALFGGESKTDGPSTGEKGPNIVIHIDLKGKSNQVISFARMAEEKYGFAALYPRQAAQKERLARVAAAGAALERSANSSKRGGSGGESGDEDLSVDVDRDSENDGDIAMGGMNGGQDTGPNSGTDAAAPKRRRRRKIEEYDQDDPFVDDSEMLWEAQAAASKDGFFVYSGPLVPEGEKATVERYVWLYLVL